MTSWLGRSMTPPSKTAVTLLSAEEEEDEAEGATRPAELSCGACDPCGAATEPADAGVACAALAFVDDVARSEKEGPREDSAEEPSSLRRRKVSSSEESEPMLLPRRLVRRLDPGPPFAEDELEEGFRRDTGDDDDGGGGAEAGSDPLLAILPSALRKPVLGSGGRGVAIAAEALFEALLIVLRFTVDRSLIGEGNEGSTVVPACTAARRSTTADTAAWIAGSEKPAARP